jgi:hypothetical protein
MKSSITVLAGKTARQQIQQNGLNASTVAVIPAAAGGPKGLILQALDQWLFGTWLPAAPRTRSLIGASIGAWRMAAAAHADPVAAFARLGELYCGQRYPDKPGAEYISRTCVSLLDNFIGGHEAEIVRNPHYHLHLLAVRGRGLLHQPRNSRQAKLGFIAATLANLRARPALARHLERVMIGADADELGWLKRKFDAFATHFVPLSEENLAQSLLASGTLPLIMAEVQHIAHAPQGSYWDGGLIDYHLALPYSRLPENELVLYPHFTDHIVPGWLDKGLPWRRAHKGGQRDWLDNVVLVAPSREFLLSLPRRKLPDRKDFQFYGQDHDARIQAWQTAIAEGQRMRDDLARFAEKPEGILALN